VILMGAGARIEWCEVRHEELFFVIAEKNCRGWVFAERSTWEVTWFPCPTTPERLRHAEAIAAHADAAAEQVWA
jgi:hypothetical protein